MKPAVVAERYEVVREVGRGGMGVVYEAVHLSTRRRVAMKMLHPSALAASDLSRVRFEREVLASGAVDSEHIVQVLDAGTDPESESPFMVMELLKGAHVGALVRRLGPLRPDLALRIAAQAALGLSKAHAAGVVHRDIKLSNLFLAERDRGRVVVKVLDFGVAKLTIDQLTREERGPTRTGSVVGSPHYMSPEQAQGLKTIDHRTDLWSLGVVLYKMLTGRTPFDHLDTLGQIIIGICSEPAAPLQDGAPWVSAEIADLVHRALAIDPDERFASADEMLVAIERHLPSGHDLDALAFEPMTPAERQVVAVRSKRVPARPRPSRSVSGPDAPTVVTAGGVTSPSVSASIGSRRSRGVAVFALVAFGIAAATLAAIRSEAWNSWRSRTGAAEPPASSLAAATPETAPPEVKSAEPTALDAGALQPASNAPPPAAETPKKTGRARTIGKPLSSEPTLPAPAPAPRPSKPQPKIDTQFD